MRSCSLVYALVLLGALALSAPRAGAERAVQLEALALSGEPAPELDLPFRGFSTPRIDAAGDVGFHAFCGDPFEAAVDAIWLSIDGGTPTLVTTFDDPPGVSSPLVALWSLVVTARGVAFDGQLDQAARALWDAGAAGAPTLLAVEGELAPVPERRFSSLGAVAASDGGAAFRAQLSDAQSAVPVGEALFWRAGGGTTEAIAVAGGEAFEAGTTWSLIGSPLVDPAGGIAFFAQVHDGATHRFQLFAPDGAGGWAVRMREGDPAPGTGLPFNAVDPAPALWGLNGAGEVAFAGARAVGIGDGERAGVWGPDDSGGLRLLALGGDPAPGLPGEAHLEFAAVALASDGWTAFSGVTDASGLGPAVGLWAAHRSGPTLAVATRGGDAGIGGAVVERIDAFAIASGGRVFVQGAARRLVDDAVLDALWLRELPDGPLEPLLVEGDLVETGSGAKRLHGYGPFFRAITIADTSSGGEDGKGSAANDAGQLAAVLRFALEDGAGAGIFRVTVPEPGFGGGLALVAVGVLGLRGPRRGAQRTLPGPAPNRCSRASSSGPAAPAPRQSRPRS
jgi:hypothetical protein